MLHLIFVDALRIGEGTFCDKRWKLDRDQAREMPSNYFLRLQHAIRQGVWRLGSEKDSRIKDHVDILIGEWKVLCGHSKLIHSLPSWVLNDLNAPARANSHICNRKQNLSVFGAFSRVISVPSVSGPSFQVYGHHIDCLLAKPSQLSGINARRKANAYPFIGLGFKGLRSSSTACSSARDLSFSNSMREEWHSSSTNSSGLYVSFSLLSSIFRFNS